MFLTYFGLNLKYATKTWKKRMGLYELESISNANICAIVVHPKQYFEKFKKRTINKRHKCMWRDTERMNFESYAERVATLKESDNEKNKKQLVEKRLQVTNTKMKMTNANKYNLLVWTIKGTIFLDGIVSSPYKHPLLSKIC